MIDEYKKAFEPNLEILILLPTYNKVENVFESDGEMLNIPEILTS